MAKVWWIKRDGDGQLGLMSRPEVEHLREELRELRNEGAEEIICLMTENEIDEHGLNELGDACDREGLAFKRFGLPAEGVPQINSGLDDFLQATARDLRNGRKIVLQCNTGRGRCAMVAAALMALEGTGPESSMKAIRAARHAKAPHSPEQEDWIRMYAQQSSPFRHEREETGFSVRKVHPAIPIGIAAGLLSIVAAVLVIRRRR